MSTLVQYTPTVGTSLTFEIESWAAVKKRLRQWRRPKK